MAGESAFAALTSAATETRSLHQPVWFAFSLTGTYVGEGRTAICDRLGHEREQRKWGKSALWDMLT